MSSIFSGLFDETTTQYRKKSIAIFCNTLKAGDDPFRTDYYWQSYQDLYLALKQRGVEVYFTTDNDSYLGDGLFETAYTINAKTPLDKITEVQNISVDMVFNRGNFNGQGVDIINTPFVQKIGRDKIATYEYFAQFQPFSVVCRNKGELLKSLDKIETEKVVVKEPAGYGGHQVYIGNKQEILSKVPDKFPLLLQEFLDTSIGVPGHATGIHDVRLSMCGGELIGCYIRQAKPGELRSNVAQGGTMVFLDVNDAPREAVLMAYKIDELFAAHPRYYAADFINTTSGWKMIELNPLVALTRITDGPESIKTLNKLADYLVDVCVKKIHPHKEPALLA